MNAIDFSAVLDAAHAAGFSGARIVPCADGICRPREDAAFQTKSILVLFSRYRPEGKSGKGRIGISAYYAASNKAYADAGMLAERLAAMGIPARRDSTLPARSAALLTGGHIGKNGFYYHPEFGSLVHIQTIRLGIEAQEKGSKVHAECLHCGACASACPAGAITDAGVDVSKCLRSHMDGAVPDSMKPFVYQLLGCEVCQTACPLNQAGGSALLDFDLAATIRGETMDALREVAGKNMARRVRVTNQALMVAANRMDKSVLYEVLAFAGDERFADACRYYLEKTGQLPPKND